MNVGTLRRTKAQLVVLRGWDPNGTTKRETVAPRAAGIEIKSGQVCHLAWNSTLGIEEFRMGCVGTATPHIAKYDWDDSMIAGSGLFSALSCADAYELQTPYYNTDDATAGYYTYNSYLTFDAATGNVRSCNTTEVSAALASTVLGQVSKNNGLVNVASSTSNVTPDANGAVNVLQFKTLYFRLDTQGA